jgi:hypothetical protein
MMIYPGNPIPRFSISCTLSNMVGVYVDCFREPLINSPTWYTPMSSRQEGEAGN